MNAAIKTFLLACIVTLMPALRASAGASLESLKTSAWAPTWAEALKTAPVPELPAAKPALGSSHEGVRPPARVTGETQVYQRGGYTWESDARNALNSASSNLRAAGLAVLRAEITRETGGSWAYGFRIDYLDNADNPHIPGRKVETYFGGFYTWQSDAENELRRAESSLRASGYVLVLGQVLRQNESPWNYYYQVDYLHGRRQPGGGGQVFIYQSGYYQFAAHAQRDMQSVAWRLQSQGYAIHNSTLYQDARTRYYFFRIQYGQGWKRKN